LTWKAWSTGTRSPTSACRRVPFRHGNRPPLTTATEEPLFALNHCIQFAKLDSVQREERDLAFGFGLILIKEWHYFGLRVEEPLAFRT